MASNDFWRVFKWMDEAEDASTRILAYRLWAAALYEAARHLEETPRRSSKVDAFLSGLPQEARADQNRLCGAFDRKSPHYVGAWIERHRNVTFHYAVVMKERADRGQEELKQALERAIAQGIPGTISTPKDKFGAARFAFADEVAVQWLPDGDTAQGRRELGSLQEAGLALARFAQRAIGAHLDALPVGVVTHHH